MGICVSKCCPVPPPPSPSLTNASDRTQEKLVIPQSLQPLTNQLSKIQPSPPTSSYTSSSSSSASSSLLNSGTSSSTSTSTSIGSCTSTGNSSRSRSTMRPFSNEFLLSTAAKNSNIVILDPSKRSTEKPRTTKPPTTNCEQPRKVTSRAPPSPRQTVAVSNQPFPSKRARSASPMSRAGRKTVRTEPCPVEAPQVRSQLSTPSTLRGQSNVRKELKRREVVLPRNVRKENLRSTTTTTATATSSYRSSSFKSSSIETEAFLQQIHQFEPRIYEIRNREVMSMQSCSSPPLAEELNNPLISMDCFIFL